MYPVITRVSLPIIHVEPTPGCEHAVAESLRLDQAGFDPGFSTAKDPRACALVDAVFPKVIFAHKFTLEFGALVL